MKPSRRQFVHTGRDALVVGFSLCRGIPSVIAWGQTAAPTTSSAKPVLPEELDSWLSIGGDGKVTVYTGRIDMGTGAETAFGQLVADELDVRFESVKIVMGDTELTPDQGKSTASSNASVGARPLRVAAAEARRTLLKMAADRFAVSADELDVEEGIVRLRNDSSKRISYAELISGGRFRTRLDQKIQSGEEAERAGTVGMLQPVSSSGLHLKAPGELRLVGKSVPRVDVPAKVTASFPYVHNVRVPSMLHGRVIRPPKIESRLVSVDESSVRGAAGLVKVVRKGNFLGVVAEREEQAMEAARLLKVEWTGGRTLPDYQDLYKSVRAAKPVQTDVPTNSGNVDAALASAAKVLEATYTYPVQLHGMLGPSCAVADVREGRATIWSGSQWIQGDRRNLAKMLGIPLENVHSIWVEASGSYGRLGCDDAAADAALLSQAAGRPVRVQWMRHDEHGWEPMSPAMAMDLRAGLDAQGHIVAFDFQQWSQSHSRGESGNSVAWRLAGGNPDWNRLSGGPYPCSYEFPSKRMSGHYVDELFRSIYLRAPGRIQGNFAIESFVDEIAASQQVDPVEFRREYLKDAMALQVFDAAVQAAGWQPRPRPRPKVRQSVISGRGISFGEHGPEKRATIVADVQVDRTSGRVRVSKVVIAVACGRIINPQGLRHQVQGAVLQGISRTLFEAVKFDRSHVTSLDWLSYPVLRFPDVPDIETVLIDQREVEPSGAGELATVPVAAALCNAVFDATGVRLRQVPLTPERIKSALG
ncbi:MAG TPA: molybdopterin cofactor-binding domain-containing protein [Bryobacteraceae bacterium]|nr:molybdopterin cofactor-binding domain-containing protein [Bryobacteraceae bacterium]